MNKSLVVLREKRSMLLLDWRIFWGVEGGLYFKEVAKRERIREQEREWASELLKRIIRKRETDSLHVGKTQITLLASFLGGKKSYRETPRR
mmetsp:Transcript_12717/g.17033  ORF Transcript_12717/g.17033 Transcript_12717/m.17033 type:complete len:91 (-) Transcript_12717:54-326(-)